MTGHCTGHHELSPPPPASRFPLYPASWYLFCHRDELRRGLLSKTMLGRRLVAYRTATGLVTVLDARCSHLGADLGRGCVVGQRIRCPFHNWEYGPDGQCGRIPGTSTVPAFARQFCYPVREQHGFVFVFNGPEPLFPLPFFFDERPEDFVPGKPFRFVGSTSWYMLAANGFDEEHFRAVHDRTLQGPPEVDCPTQFSRRMRYTARITGHSTFDRLLRGFVGPVVRVSITSWGGPLILVTGFFHRARSYLLIATQPIDVDSTLVETIVFAPRRLPLLQPLGLWMRRLFTRGFMQDDIGRLGGIRYSPHTLVEGDRLMIEFFVWAATLPQHACKAEPSVHERDRGRDDRAWNLEPTGQELAPERQ